ncbi:MAG: heme-binding domain-containing protein [Myxococcota bacterium]
MNPSVRWGVGMGVVALAQLLPVERVNPPVESEVPTTAEARGLLVRACFDCHSNEVVWPWYSRVAPVSWLVAKDVREGRDELNFSTWLSYDAKKQRKLLKETLEEVDQAEMPLGLYLLAHPEARLAAADRDLLQRWVDERLAALDAAP